MASNQQDELRRKIVAPTIGKADQATAWWMLIPLWLGSATIQLGLVGVFLLITTITEGRANTSPRASVEEFKIETKIEDDSQPPDLDLTNKDLGDNTKLETNYNNTNIQNISAPGEVNPQETPGILNGQDTIVQSIPKPAGTGGGTGLAALTDMPGVGSNAGTPGGMGGLYTPGGIGGRTGSTKEQMLEEGGGNKESEAAVARGLAWLAAHQAPDGHWSLNKFDKNGRDKAGTMINGSCGCTGATKSLQNDSAATGMALLPFLGAGHTQRPLPGSKQTDYSKTVQAGLAYLMKIQVRSGKDEGYLGGDQQISNMYGHAIATIALCEAFGMTNDPTLRQAAQRAISFIVTAQSKEAPAKGGGGWRYTPKQAGDTSVTGWQVMALKSGHMAGLAVPAKTFDAVDAYLDACKVDFESGSKAKLVGYSYTGGSGQTHTMTAVALLCKEYLGVNPKNPDLLRGLEYLKEMPPAASQENIYYQYYATQVFHHIGGTTWDFWNLGPDGKTGIRDTLIKRQDKGKDPKLIHQEGSWAPNDSFGNTGGRIMWTSLSLLTLEVYYRHLPLYGKSLGTMKEKP